MVVVAKIVLHFPIKIPGHSGVFWMALVVVALGIVPKLGAGCIVGLTSALLAAFLGLGDLGPVYTFFSYLVLGVASDLAAWFMGSLKRAPSAVLVGVTGNVSKMLAKTLMARLLGIPSGFLAFGLLTAFGTNLVAGAIGGFLGWCILVALERAGFFLYLAEKH